jgi:hypothetical protein
VLRPEPAVHTIVSPDIGVHKIHRIEEEEDAEISAVVDT